MSTGRPDYRACLTNTNSSIALECIVNSLESDTTAEDVGYGLDVTFVIIATTLMFFMQAGFAVLCAGCVRSKNVQNTLMKNFLDACGAAIGFWSIGYAFAYGETLDRYEKTFIGHHGFFMTGVTDYSLWLFNFAFAATAATIVAGTLAERCQMISYLAYSTLLTGFVYPVVVHSAWSTNGFLSPANMAPIANTGFVDFAGSGVVHVTGGVTALIAVKILGPRKGRFHDNVGSLLVRPKKIQGHSVSLQVLGTFILWFGWYGFNAGSALKVSDPTFADLAARAAVSTTLGAASGTISSLTLSAFIAERTTGETLFDITNALNGCLAGLVSITAGCALIEPWAAVLIGSVAGVIYVFASDLLVKLQIDDAVDAIPVHFFNGMWGVIAVGLFAVPEYLQDANGRSEHVGWFYSMSRGSADATLLGVNILGLIFIIGWTAGIMLPFFLVLSYLGWFRADALEELVGLDVSYHGGPAQRGDENGSHTSTIMTDAMKSYRYSTEMRKEGDDDDDDENLNGVDDYIGDNGEVELITPHYGSA